MGNQQLIMANDNDRPGDSSSNATTDTEQDYLQQQIRRASMKEIEKEMKDENDEKGILCVSTSNGKAHDRKNEKSQSRIAVLDPDYLKQELIKKPTENNEKNHSLLSNSFTQNTLDVSSAIDINPIRSQMDYSVDKDHNNEHKGLTCFDYSSIQYNKMDIFVACAKGDLPVVALLLNRILYSQHASLFRHCQHYKQKIPPKIQSISEIINVRDDQKNNPLHYAALSNNYELIELLIETEKSYRDDCGNQYDGEDLIHVQNTDGETALLRAALIGHLPVIRKLIFYNSSLSISSKLKQNIVINAAKNNHYHVIHYVLSFCSPSLCSTLLHQVDEDGHSALDWACNDGHLDTVEYLIYRGLNPCVVDKYGRNALHWAVRGPHLPVIAYLVALGMSPDIPDVDGISVNDFAKDNSAIKYALKYPAHVCGYRAGATMGLSSVFINDTLGRVVLRASGKSSQKNRCNNKEKDEIENQGKTIIENVRFAFDEVPNLKASKQLSWWRNMFTDKTSSIHGVHPSLLRNNPLRASYFSFYALFTFVLGCFVLFLKCYISLVIFLLLGLALFIINRGQRLIRRNRRKKEDRDEQDEATNDEALGIVGIICDTVASKQGARVIGLIGNLYTAHERLIGFWFGLNMLYGLVIFGGWMVYMKPELGKNEELPLFVLTFVGKSVPLTYPYFLIVTISYIMTSICWLLLFTIYNDPGTVYTCRAASYYSILQSIVSNCAPPDREQWCTATFHLKPFRAKYDAPTGLLVARHDHYCPWLNNAVGYGNHRMFVIFLFWHNIVLISILIWGVIAIRHDARSGDDYMTRCELSERMLSREVYGVVVMIFCAFIFACGTFILLVIQIRNILENVTINERINWKRYSYMTRLVDERVTLMNMEDIQFYNRFDTGSKWKNWKQFWCKELDYSECFNIPETVDAENSEEMSNNSSGYQEMDIDSSVLATMM